MLLFYLGLLQLLLEKLLPATRVLLTASHQLLPGCARRSTGIKNCFHRSRRKTRLFLIPFSSPTSHRELSHF